MVDFEKDIEAALEALRSGGIILYPTDTVWGIGCDATNAQAIDRIMELKKRPPSKSMIVLVAEERDVLQWVAAPDPEVFVYLEQTSRPTTVIFDNAIGLADNLLAEDGSIGIRICQEPFCRHLIKRLRKPLVSTSANFSGDPTPAKFADISPGIIAGVDYVVSYRQQESMKAVPSAIIKFQQGQIKVLRS